MLYNASMKFIVHMDKRGRIVIPLAVRKAWGISNGGRLVLKVEDDTITIWPVEKKK
jgi:AbrB family looped-hinge helix DNA binding protein